MTIKAVPCLPSNFLVTSRPEITTSNKHWALAWQRPAGEPGPHRRGPWVSDPVRPRAAPQPRVLAPRDFGGEMHFAGPDGRAARRGPEFPKCPEPFPVASATPRLRPPGGPPAPGPRAEPLPSPRGGAAPRRPSACQPRLPGRAAPRTRPVPAALTWRLSPTGRASGGRRPSPARPAESTSRPRAPRARRVPRAAGGGGREHARARGAGGGHGEAGLAASVMARGAAVARCVLSVRSPLV